MEAPPSTQTVVSKDGDTSPTRGPSTQTVVSKDGDTSPTRRPSTQTAGSRDSDTSLSGATSHIPQRLRLAHRGHQNVLYRGLAKVGDVFLTASLLYFGIDTPHKILNLCCQATSAITLLVQWRTGRPTMFLIRAASNFVAAVVLSHGVACGPYWPGEVCSYPPYDDLRQVAKALAAANVVKILANMTSLVLHWRFPYRMFAGHGCEQLFWRGCIQACGIPISLLQGVLKWWLLSGTASAPHPSETIVSFISALVLTPIAAWSLFNQWWLTAKGATGHPVSDVHEKDLNPDTHNPRERVKVTIKSAKDLANADWNLSKSDPFCICEVVGRPESTWQTEVVFDNLNPAWDQDQVLEEYRRGDTLKFTVFDYDDYRCLKGLKFFQERNDCLGWAELQSDKFHPDKFDDDLRFIVHRGKHRHPTLQVAVEVLEGFEPERSFTLGIIGDMMKRGLSRTGTADFAV